MNPDTLIAIHAIVDFLGKIKEKDVSNRLSQTHADYVNWDAFFHGPLLWGCISFGNNLRPEGGRYERLKHPPIADFMNVLHRAGLDDIGCLMGVRPEEIPRYEKTGAFYSVISESEENIFYDEATALLWQRLKKESGKEKDYIETTLGEAFRLCNDFLLVREQTVNAALAADSPLAEPLEKQLHWLINHQPFSLSLLCPQYQKIHTVLSEIENSYLDAFMAGHIVWPENIMRWERQVDEIWPKLKELHDEYGIFWAEPWSFVDPQAMDAGNGYVLLSGITLAETLLAMVKTGKIRIHEMAANNQNDIQFRIELLEGKAADDTEKAKATVTPLYTLTRHELRGELAINGNPFASPQMGSTADRLMEELMNRNKERRIVKLIDSDLQQIRGSNKKYRIPNVLTDLGFTGDLRKAFFPSSSNNGLVFVNPVHAEDLLEQHVQGFPQFDLVQ